MKAIILSLYLLAVWGCKDPPPPPKETSGHYVFVWGFDAQGGIFRKDVTVACEHPRTSTLCAVPCANLVDITVKIDRLEDAFVASQVCSEESKGAAEKVAQSIDMTQWEVWGFDGMGGIFRKDASLTCFDSYLHDMCATSCDTLEYLSSKARRLITLLVTSENCLEITRSNLTASQKRELLELHQASQSLKIELERLGKL